MRNLRRKLSEAAEDQLLTMVRGLGFSLRRGGDAVWQSRSARCAALLDQSTRQTVAASGEHTPASRANTREQKNAQLVRGTRFTTIAGAGLEPATPAL